MAMGSVPPSPSWDPIQTGNYNMNEPRKYHRQVKMGDLANGLSNEAVGLVRGALSDCYPDELLPGILYDDDVIKCIKKWQKHMGEDLTGKMTRDQVIALGKQSNPKFGVV